MTGVNRANKTLIVIKLFETIFFEALNTENKIKLRKKTYKKSANGIKDLFLKGCFKVSKFSIALN